MAVFNIVGNSSFCGSGCKKILVPFKYAIGSTVFIKSQAQQGIMSPVVIESFEFIRNVKFFGVYYVYYNNQYYEDELIEEADARALAIAYWTNQEQIVLKQLASCCK